MISIATAIADALRTSDPHAKVMVARRVARDWRLDRLAWRFDANMPDRPGRPAQPELLSATRMPKRRKAGSDRARIAMLHALAHIEFVAIDLALDMAGRFGNGQPRAFITDWLKVAADEALHFALIDRHLKTLGSFYGALPAHDGLWEAAEGTSGDILGRLAVVPMVLEARGLDVTPAMIARFEKAGDQRVSAILQRIYNDEIVHVGTGVRWFEALCSAKGLEPVSQWHELVNRYFRGALKAPFNDSARVAAGLTIDFYMPLAVNAEPRQNII